MYLEETTYLKMLLWDHKSRTVWDFEAESAKKWQEWFVPADFFKKILANFQTLYKVGKKLIQTLMQSEVEVTTLQVIVLDAGWSL